MSKFTTHNTNEEVDSKIQKFKIETNKNTFQQNVISSFLFIQKTFSHFLENNTNSKQCKMANAKFNFWSLLFALFSWHCDSLRAKLLHEDTTCSCFPSKLLLYHN